MHLWVDASRIEWALRELQSGLERPGVEVTRFVEVLGSSDLARSHRRNKLDPVQRALSATSSIVTRWLLQRNPS